ncbi:urease subunit gamma [Streptomyces sp. YC537]|uniref:urease n=1 Tax=Streptomyces boluensis TaxID=1775135 RepID=A0A964UST0_9ACTN|nr:urease subunit gamma [Streptomyces boluensis]
MHMTPRERERLELFTVAELARRRLARGRRLNAPEAIALICDEILEAAWDGIPLEGVIEVARKVLTEADVMEGVPAMIPQVQVEALFPSGTSLVAVDRPISTSASADTDASTAPGEVRLATEPVVINPSRQRSRLSIRNTGDRTVYLSSHYPLAEANAALDLDRRAAAGMRLDIPAGTALAFEPGVEREVEVVSARHPSADAQAQEEQA